MLHVPACICMDLVAFFPCVCPQAQLCVLCRVCLFGLSVIKKTVSEVGCCHYDCHKWWFCTLHTTFLSTHLLPMSLMVMSPHTNSHLTLCCWSYSPFILVCPAWGNPGGVSRLKPHHWHSEHSSFLELSFSLYASPSLISQHTSTGLVSDLHLVLKVG